MLHVAFALTNLTSNKIEDGVSKLLSKSDFTRLAVKSAQADALKYERILQDALDMVDKLSNRSKALQTLGQLFVRLILHITKKEKLSRDSEVRSIPEIQKLFLDDLGKLIGKRIDFEAWETQGVESKPAVPTATKANPTSAVASLDDHSSPKRILKQHGFAIGKHVMQKYVAADAEKLFVVFEVGNDVKLQQVCSFSNKFSTVTVTMETLIAEWAPSKLEPPMKMTGSQTRSKNLAIDVQRALIYTALIDSDPKSAAQANLAFWRRPDAVRVGDKPIKKGALVLVPIVPLINITAKAVSSPNAVSFGKYTVGDSELVFFALPMPKPPLQNQQKTVWPDDVTVAAYWWVEDQFDKKAVNMEEDTITKHGVTIPILRNSVDLAPHTRLTKLVNPVAKTASPKSAQAASSSSAKAKAKDTAKAPPAKKQKPS